MLSNSLSAATVTVCRLYERCWTIDSYLRFPLPTSWKQHLLGGFPWCRRPWVCKLKAMSFTMRPERHQSSQRTNWIGQRTPKLWTSDQESPTRLGCDRVGYIKCNKTVILILSFLKSMGSLSVGVKRMPPSVQPPKSHPCYIHTYVILIINYISTR